MADLPSIDASVGTPTFEMHDYSKIPDRLHKHPAFEKAMGIVRFTGEDS